MYMSTIVSGGCNSTVEDSLTYLILKFTYLRRINSLVVKWCLYSIFSYKTNNNNTQEVKSKNHILIVKLAYPQVYLFTLI